jgi:hypothetical protein
MAESYLARQVIKTQDTLNGGDLPNNGWSVLLAGWSVVPMYDVYVHSASFLSMYLCNIFMYTMYLSVRAQIVVRVGCAPHGHIFSPKPQP